MAARLLVIAASCWASIAYGAEVLIGEVVGINDGDTLTILVDREFVKVRFAEFLFIPRFNRGVSKRG